MNYLRFFSLLMVTLLAAACASTTPPPPQYQASANSFQPPAGMGGLYVFKEGSLVPAADSHQVTLDGRLLGLVSSAAYLYTPVSPGAHIVTSDASQVSLTVQAGQNYFVRQKSNLNSSGQVTQSTLTVVPSSVAMPQIKTLQGSDYSE